MSAFKKCAMCPWNCAEQGRCHLTDESRPQNPTVAPDTGAAASGVMGPVVTPELPDTSQEWARVDAMIAYHLIDRHGDDWAQIGRMMESWRIARTAYLAARSAPAVPTGVATTPQGETCAVCGGSGDISSTGSKGEYLTACHTCHGSGRSTTRDRE